MKSKKLYHCSYFFLLAAFWNLSAFAQTPTPTPENVSVSAPKSEIDLIHLGDLVDVDVIGSLEYDWRGTVNPEGFLDGVHYAENPIYALCRSEESVAEEIAKSYSKILRDPKVVVKILDRSNRPLAVLYGAVKTPQRFQIKRQIYLNELIIVSGGLTDKASGEIQVYRPKNLSCAASEKQSGDNKTADGEEKSASSETTEQNGDANYINVKISDLLAGKKEANPQILSGDIVTVQEAESIYVIGGVANPKPISSRSQITLSRAIASAGGTTKDADEKKITIYRREAGETKIIEADLEKIKDKKADDIVLKAFDIVEVPQSGRGKRKLSPMFNIDDSNGKNTANLPLRIIE
ncbi:MAG: polysaccharide biosynthesis/export family protein [Pyrinomonadaceae bacterium]